MRRACTFGHFCVVPKLRHKRSVRPISLMTWGSMHERARRTRTWRAAPRRGRRQAARPPATASARWRRARSRKPRRPPGPARPTPRLCPTRRSRPTTSTWTPASGPCATTWRCVRPTPRKVPASIGLRSSPNRPRNRHRNDPTSTTDRPQIDAISTPMPPQHRRLEERVRHGCAQPGSLCSMLAWCVMCARSCARVIRRGACAAPVPCNSSSGPRPGPGGVPAGVPAPCPPVIP